MKAFPKTFDFNLESDQVKGELQRKYHQEFRDRVAKKLYTEHFANAEMFLEFRSRWLIEMGIAQLFEEGVITFVHWDTSYVSCQIVDHEFGPVLCLPPHPRYADFRAVVDSYMKPAKK